VHFLSVSDSLLGAYHFQGGIVVDPENIKAIMEWLAPRNLDKIRSFMGIACYYR